MKIDYAFISDRGGRQENQDQYGQIISADGSRACFVVADGLGGYSGGELAATIAVGTILDVFNKHDLRNPGAFFAEALDRANEAIIEEQSKGYESMRSTCAVLIVRKGKAYWAHVGDTRIYHLEGNHVINQTRDHSVVQMMVEMGEITPEEMRGHPDRNRIVRSLGSPDPLKPSVQLEGIELTRASSFLLCTDGFWEHMLEEEMCRELPGHRSSRSSLAACERIIQSRLKEESDNYTAQVVRFPDAPVPRRVATAAKAPKAKKASRKKPRWAMAAAAVLLVLLLACAAYFGYRQLSAQSSAHAAMLQARTRAQQARDALDMALVRAYAQEEFNQAEHVFGEAGKDERNEAYAQASKSYDEAAGLFDALPALAQEKKATEEAQHAQEAAARAEAERKIQEALEAKKASAESVRHEASIAGAQTYASENWQEGEQFYNAALVEPEHEEAMRLYEEAENEFHIAKSIAPARRDLEEAQQRNRQNEEQDRARRQADARRESLRTKAIAEHTRAMEEMKGYDRDSLNPMSRNPDKLKSAKEEYARGKALLQEGSLVVTQDPEAALRHYTDAKKAFQAARILLRETSQPTTQPAPSTDSASQPGGRTQPVEKRDADVSTQPARPSSSPPRVPPIPTSEGRDAPRTATPQAPSPAPGNGTEGNGTDEKASTKPSSAETRASDSAPPADSAAPSAIPPENALNGIDPEE